MKLVKYCAAFALAMVMGQAQAHRSHRSHKYFNLQFSTPPVVMMRPVRPVVRYVRPVRVYQPAVQFGFGFGTPGMQFGFNF